MKNKKNIFIGLVLVVALFLISEFVYIMGNDVPRSTYIYLTASKLASNLNLQPLSYKFLEISRFNNSIKISEKYLYGKPDPAVKIIIKNDGFWESYKNVIQNAVIKPKNNRLYANMLSKIYYDLGKNAYEQGDKDLAYQMLNASISLAPEWSYYYLELANLYLINGNKEKSLEIINRCTKYIYPREHCTSFKNDYLEGGNKDAAGFGFMETLINENIKN